jgi:RimJ/RimL family protein N-acetyltransferase
MVERNEVRLRGPRVTLRPTIATDLADYERWQAPDLAAHRLDGPWFEDSGSPGLLDRRRRWLDSKPAPPFNHLELDALGRHVGWVVVYPRPGDRHLTEAGISIMADSEWGRGLGTEALALWVDHLFRERGLTRLGLATWSGNPAMMRVAHKLGFAPEARIREGCEVEGRFHDRLRYGLLRREWEQVRAGWPLSGRS